MSLIFLALARMLLTLSLLAGSSVTGSDGSDESLHITFHTTVRLSLRIGSPVTGSMPL